MNNRVAMLDNYSQNEGDCECGCGMKLAPAYVIRAQAFIYVLKLLYGTDIRHIVTSGARCKSRNDATEGSAKFSQHLNGLATDGYYEKKTDKGWVRIPPAEIAGVAVRSKLFTGIGWVKYKNTIIHLDARKGHSITVW